MAIGEQFAGLDMEQLIGGPLTAVAGASTMLANSTADFIKHVGFDSTGKLRTAAFGYQKHTVNEDGTSNLDEMKVDVPILSIVPIPNLQVDEVNILFDMEVKESSMDKSSRDLNVGFSGSARFGPVKIKVSGSVSAHKESTRSTDNSAKYHVDVRATNHGTPEGLARVLDMMAANVAPALVSSSLKDGNGQELQEAAKIRANKLKACRGEIARIEERLTAARNSLSDRISQLKRVGSAQQNIYQADFAGLEDSGEAGQNEALAGEMEKVIQSWRNLQEQASETVRMISDCADGELSEVSGLFDLLKLNEENKAERYAGNERQYEALLKAQNSAVAAQRKCEEIEKELYGKKEEYNRIVSDTAAAEEGGRTPALQG